VVVRQRNEPPGRANAQAALTRTLPERNPLRNNTLLTLPRNR
jgi:hypothetical protein